MSSVLSKWTGLQERVGHARARRAQLAQLAAGDDPTCARIAWAIDAVIRRSLLESEEAWIERIEARRRELAESGRDVTFTDFGAGEPDDDLDAATMERGRSVTLSLHDLCHHTSQSYPWAHLLHQLVRQLRPKRCLELGTCLGFSAAYQAAGLELNKSGRLVTLEGAQPLADLATSTFDSLGLHSIGVRVGRFQDLLDDVLEQDGPFGFVYIDGHHDGDATLDYFARIAAHLVDDAVVVFDDILWYDGMRHAWERLREDERVRVAIDLNAMGIVVVHAHPVEKKTFSFLLH